MATGSSSKAAGASGTSRRAAGHAARTKVAIPGAETAGSSPSGRKAKGLPPAPPKPWYRRGRFWFAVIVLEVVVAFALSIVYAPKSDDVALDGADFTKFCPLITKGQALGVATDPNDAGQVARFWGARADLMRQLSPVAPEALRPDLADLAQLAQSVQDQAGTVQARQAVDPAYDGHAVIEAREGQVGSEGDVAMRRLNVVVLRGCGVDLSAPTTVPSSTPVAPASTAGGPSTTASRPAVVGPTTGG